jgi:hypothetical protein
LAPLRAQTFSFFSQVTIFFRLTSFQRTFPLFSRVCEERFPQMRVQISGFYFGIKHIV